MNNQAVIATSVSRFSEDFLRGQRDAKEGVQHRPGMSGWYDRGYAAQMESEAVQSEAVRRTGI